MNYIKELNAFHDRIIFEPLTSSAISLWIALMHFNNKSGWRRHFTVAASQLQCQAGLKPTTFKRAREELRVKGYILVTACGANRAATYHMISQQSDFTETAHDQPANEANEPFNNRREPSAETPAHTTGCTADLILDHTLDRSMDPLFKQNNRKHNQTQNPPADERARSVIQFYRDNFEAQAPGVFIQNDIQTWINTSGDELVHHAMTIALERGKANWHYVKGILKAWQGKNITTVGAAKTEMTSYRNNPKHRKPNPYASRTEVIPDWFRNLKQQQHTKQAGAEDKSNITSEAETREELEKLLKTYTGAAGG